MSKGLVSKWASDDDLKPKSTDASYTKPESKPSKRTPTKLDSKWADAAEETTPSPSNKPKSPKGRRPSKGNKLNNVHPHDKPKYGNQRKYSDGEVKLQLHTPPSSRDKDADEQELAPMTDAARSFAARLGGKSKPPKASGNKHLSREQSHPNQHTHHKGDEKHRKPNEKHHHANEKHHNSDDEERLPVMTSGNTLAARLGMGIKSSKEGTKYIPPKQKRLMEQKAQAEKEAQLKAQQEELEREKHKSEMDRLVKEMEDSNISWADMDD